MGRDTETVSDFYPPRARWYSGIFSFGSRCRRALYLDRIRLPARLTVLQVLLSIAIPGFAFFTNRRRVLGWTFVSGYCVAAVVFVVALGYRIGSIGYGVMIGAHATSIIFLEGYWVRERCQFGARLVLAGLTLLVVWLAVYAPLVDFAQNHLVMPLSVRGNVVVVRRVAAPERIQRGDVVMCSFDENSYGDGHRGGAVWIRAGFGCGPVLATAGDRVEFSTNSFSINGTARKLLPHMPTDGNLIVPEKHWFIWPEFDIRMNGNVGEAAISATMTQWAIVPEGRFAGKPFKRWFGRRQILL